MPPATPPLPLILLVEDNPDLRALALDLLEMSGYQVVGADGLGTAIAAFEQAQPDLVLTDVKFPAGSGLALLAHIRAHPARSSTPVMLMSGEREQAGAIMGADGFVQKPFDVEALLTSVAELIARHCATASIEAKTAC
ncbi:MAG: hypothetical protein RIQ93_1754 [Verrucomicrobiota bacterium]